MSRCGAGRRAAASSVAPIFKNIAAPCVLASRRPSSASRRAIILNEVLALRGCSRGFETWQVSPPDVRDVIRCKADEEHGRRGPWRGLEGHARLFEQTIALAMVARSAGGDHVLPDGGAPARPRDDVVERQPVSTRPAVRALPPVTREEDAARDSPGDTARNPDVRPEADHVRPLKARARGAERPVVALEDLRLALPDEYVRAAERTDVQGLVARIEDEDALHRARSVAPVYAFPALAERQAICMIRANMHNTLHGNVAIAGASGYAGQQTLDRVLGIPDSSSSTRIRLVR